MDKYDAYPSLRWYDKMGCPYIVTSDAWKGPLWTGCAMMLCTRDSYGDEGFFHELWHWWTASEKQRKYADLALGKWVNCDPGVTFTSSTTEFLNDNYRDGNQPPGHNNGWGEPTISIDDAHVQEIHAVNMMCYYSPLVLKAGWKDDKSNGAWGDFGAEMTPISGHRRTYDDVLSKVSRVSWGTVEKYLDRNGMVER